MAGAALPARTGGAIVMKATLEHVASEPRTYVLRVHPDSGAVMGDPYVAAGTVTVDHREVATVRGFIGDGYDFAVWSACAEAFASVGIKWACWRRIRNGQVRDVKVRVL